MQVAAVRNQLMPSVVLCFTLYPGDDQNQALLIYQKPQPPHRPQSVLQDEMHCKRAVTYCHYQISSLALIAQDT